MSDERRPCPRHPDAGDVKWMTMQQTHPLTGRTLTDTVPVCVPCLADSKPPERQEFAS